MFSSDDGAGRGGGVGTRIDPPGTRGATPTAPETRAPGAGERNGDAVGEPWPIKPAGGTSGVASRVRTNTTVAGWPSTAGGTTATARNPFASFTSTADSDSP